MEKKNFSKIEISVIKSTAKNASQFVAKKAKVEALIKEVEEKEAEKMRKRIAEKIGKLEAERANYQAIIDSMNTSVKQITGGYTTEDLVDIKKEGTGSIDSKTGKEIMKTVCVLKYPDTVVPVNEAAQEEVIEEQVVEDAEAQVVAEENADPFNEESWS